MPAARADTARIVAEAVATGDQSENAENAEIIAVHDKLQAGQLGMHLLIAAMCQVAAGASMDQAMRDLGYGVPLPAAPKAGDAKQGGS